MNWPQTVRTCFESNKVFYSNHARREMREEEFGPISDQEVYEAICSGELIESYSDDKPYPSALIFGMTLSNRPLHMLCAYNGAAEETVIVTVYHPSPEKWLDHRRRKR